MHRICYKPKRIWTKFAAVTKIPLKWISRDQQIISDLGGILKLCVCMEEGEGEKYVEGKDGEKMGKRKGGVGAS